MDLYLIMNLLVPAMARSALKLLHHLATKRGSQMDLVVFVMVRYLPTVASPDTKKGVR